MERGYLFLLIVTALNGLHVSATTSNSTVRVYQLINCPNQNLRIDLRNISINLENDTYFLGFDIDVQEDIAEDMKLEFSITRCLNRAAPDTCEQFHTFTVPYFCKMMLIPAPWLEYLKSLEPPISCPIRKGKYVLKQSIACSLKEVNRLKFGRGYFFRFTMKEIGMKTNQLLFCAKAEVSS
ncbi:hypothetical protein HUJ05_000972 [Dendroctonus ponderosae]|nr:hypothetical protein HUJ05_000972 [Dendroctonus ponderosae]